MNQTHYARFESSGARVEQKIHAVFRICFDRELKGLLESPGEERYSSAIGCSGGCLLVQRLLQRNIIP
jgi:hypothetical protein